MTTEQWIVAGVLIVSLWTIAGALDRINQKLGKLIDIAHRIRIKDHERDF